MSSMQHFHLWGRTLADQSDGFDNQRAILRHAFLESRDRVSLLVGEISRTLPNLTLHDITHLDALWRVADQIIGPSYPINPAEAFVLGQAFLLHDAAHVLAAYAGGLSEIKSTLIWKDTIAQKFAGIEPPPGSQQEQYSLFLVLRELHAKQAHELPKITWKIPGQLDELHLIPNFELREYYGDTIGEIAKSHHWSPNQVVENFSDRNLNAPACIAPAAWPVDAMKVAFILRTADAAHIDGQRAPWFLFALRRPSGVSEGHWNFQAKMGQPTLTSSGELRISSGSPFSFNECQSWWLAFDTAKMIDRELHEAELLLKDNSRPTFSATSVSRISTPEAFSSQVRTVGWEPVDVAPTISDVPKIVKLFGGAKLYGNKPDLALREIVQNAADAIHALRTLRPLTSENPKIEICLERAQESNYFMLSVTDSGIGMSKYVLTKVLPDFGNSLWSSEILHSELPGLASQGFKSTGQFGIGFFSTFMLGEQVQVTSKRYRRSENDLFDQWTLVFSNAVDGRPILRRATNDEELPQPGTRVTVKINETTLKSLFSIQNESWRIDGLGESQINSESHESQRKKVHTIDPATAIRKLCPTIDIDVHLRIGNENSKIIIKGNDWQTIPDDELLERSQGSLFHVSSHNLLELREPDGSLVGRLTYGSKYFSSAVITHQGILSGTIPHLVGVAIGNNNTDLARSSSTPIASKQAWTNFASEWINKYSGSGNVEGLTELHPLAPFIDVRVWKLGEEYLPLNSIRAWLTSRTSVVVHDGILTHDDSDDVSRYKFDSSLACNEEVLFKPPSNTSISGIAGFARIDYTQILEAVLRDVWGDFYEDTFDDEVVGSVDGVDILREVTIYTRPKSEEI